MDTQTPQKSATVVRTRRALVHLLKQEGPMDAQELAARLNSMLMPFDSRVPYGMPPDYYLG